MKTYEQVMERLMFGLAEFGAVIENSHVVLTSGKHARAYVNWVEVLQVPALNRLAAQAMAQLPGLSNIQFGAAAGPTHTGDKVAGYLTQALFDLGRGARALYAQETGQKFEYDLEGEKFDLDERNFPRGQNVKDLETAIVDDVFTTGGTLLETILAVKAAGGIPRLIIVAANRSKHRGSFAGLPIFSLMEPAMEAFERDTCLPCRERVPFKLINDHTRKFVEEFGTDPDNWPANRAA